MERKFSDLTPLCLPAKKRPTDSSFCLPAKKRIWAFQPIDLNLDISNQEIPSAKLQKSPEIHTQSEEIDNGGEQSRSKNPETTEISVNEDGDDDGVVCAVCQSTDGDSTDPIVLCDGCDLMVHTSCYGHPLTGGIPDGDWFCTQCIESKSALKTEISCCLCPVSSGALKPTTDGRWAHLVCAIYVPEVFFEDPEGRQGINCSKVLKRRWGRKCYICRSKKGCVLDCSEPKCPLAFHVTCALKEELCVEYRQRKNRGDVVAAFCRSHTDLWNKQEQTGKFKIVARDEVEK
ncbi:hypothetical protein ACS0TY_016780 [Phlomoides rotata]